MNSILNEVSNKWSEYLEMVEAEQASTTIINILCTIIQQERNEKEIYKRYYNDHSNKSIRINS
jgi:hypothetical protein